MDYAATYYDNVLLLVKYGRGNFAKKILLLCLQLQ